MMMLLLCKDCQHFAPTSGTCRRWSYEKDDPVYGEVNTVRTLARHARDDGRMCGPAGTTFTPKTEVNT